MHAKHTAKSTAFILVFIYAFSYVGTPKENGLALTLGLFFIRVKNKMFIRERGIPLSLNLPHF